METVVARFARTAAVNKSNLVYLYSLFLKPSVLLSKAVVLSISASLPGSDYVEVS
jgi:hypothetical protein